jgi:septum formation protein
VGSLILASASPRRRELLATLGVPFEVVPSRADETFPALLSPRQATERIALRKVQEVRARLAPNRWILGADTSVVVGDEILGKPRDRDEAERMLRTLSGRTHQVVTGVAFSGPAFERCIGVETEVRFRELSGPEIRWYACIDEPYDKAGAYAIQGAGAFLVAAIRGSYTNVVGLPMHETVNLLKEAGLVPWREEERGEAVDA